MYVSKQGILLSVFPHVQPLILCKHTEHHLRQQLATKATRKLPYTCTYRIVTVFTIHGVKELLNNELKELLLQSSLIHTFLSVKLNPQLLSKVDRVQLRNCLKLGEETAIYMCRK